MSFRDQLLAYVRGSKLDHWFGPDGLELDLFSDKTYVSNSGLTMRHTTTFVFDSNGALLSVELR